MFAAISAALQGKKTYLVLAALLVVSVFSSGTPEIDVSTLKEALVLGLGATFRSALTKLEK